MISFADISSVNSSASLMDSSEGPASSSSAVSSSGSSFFFFRPPFFLLIGTTLPFSTVPSSSDSSGSTLALTETFKILSIISSLLPEQETPRLAPSFLRSLNFMLISCSLDSVPSTSAPASFSSGAFITGSSFCTAALLATDLDSAPLLSDTSAPESSFLRMVAPSIIMFSPSISLSFFM